jgi:hypothetical protein
MAFTERLQALAAQTGSALSCKKGCNEFVMDRVNA